MKRLMTLVLLTVIGFSASAQQRAMMGPPSVEKRVENATEALDLSKKQQKQWTEIYKKYDVKMQEAMQNRDRELMKANMTKMEDELKETLEENQQEAYTKWNEERRKKRPF